MVDTSCIIQPQTQQYHPSSPSMNDHLFTTMLYIYIQYIHTHINGDYDEGQFRLNSECLRVVEAENDGWRNQGKIVVSIASVIAQIK